MFENITSYGSSTLSDELNDALLHSFISEYQAALRVAENEVRIFEQFGNERMALLMQNQATHYRNRIAELEARLGGGQ